MYTEHFISFTCSVPNMMSSLHVSTWHKSEKSDITRTEPLSDPCHQQASMSWNEQCCNPAEHQDIRLEILLTATNTFAKRQHVFHIKLMLDRNLIEARHYGQMVWNECRFNYCTFTYMPIGCEWDKSSHKHLKDNITL